MASIAALQAEKAALKQQNESLEIRLAAAHDKIALLQQFCEGETSMRRTAEASLQEATTALKTATEISEFYKKQCHSVAGTNEELRQELMRRGADDPWKPKPPCDTAFAALQLVSKWDRDESFADLKKQRLENLRRIDVLRSGKELMMDDVLHDMKESGWAIGHGGMDGSLHHALGELYQQLRTVYQAIPPTERHSEWEEHPLRYFTLEPDSDSEMDDDESMQDDVEEGEGM